MLKSLAQFVSGALRHYLLALQFFTRVPVTGRVAAWVGFSPAMLRASAAHFPGVGALVGAVVAGYGAPPWACCLPVLFTKTAWQMWRSAWAAASSESALCSS